MIAECGCEAGCPACVVSPEVRQRQRAAVEVRGRTPARADCIPDVTAGLAAGTRRAGRDRRPGPGGRSQGSGYASTWTCTRTSHSRCSQLSQLGPVASRRPRRRSRRARPFAAARASAPASEERSAAVHGARLCEHGACPQQRDSPATTAVAAPVQASTLGRSRAHRGTAVDQMRFTAGLGIGAQLPSERRRDIRSGPPGARLTSTRTHAPAAGDLDPRAVPGDPLRRLRSQLQTPRPRASSRAAPRAADSSRSWAPSPAPVRRMTTTISTTTGSTIAVSAVADPRSSRRRDDRADRGITTPSTGQR